MFVEPRLLLRFSQQPAVSASLLSRRLLDTRRGREGEQLTAANCVAVLAVGEKNRPAEGEGERVNFGIDVKKKTPNLDLEKRIQLETSLQCFFLSFTGRLHKLNGAVPRVAALERNQLRRREASVGAVLPLLRSSSSCSSFPSPPPLLPLPLTRGSNRAGPTEAAAQIKTNSGSLVKSVAVTPRKAVRAAPAASPVLMFSGGWGGGDPIERERRERGVSFFPLVKEKKEEERKSKPKKTPRSFFPPHRLPPQRCSSSSAPRTASPPPREGTASPPAPARASAQPSPGP